MVFLTNHFSLYLIFSNANISCNKNGKNFLKVLIFFAVLISYHSSISVNWFIYTRELVTQLVVQDLRKIFSLGDAKPFVNVHKYVPICYRNVLLHFDCFLIQFPIVYTFFECYLTCYSH